MCFRVIFVCQRGLRAAGLNKGKGVSLFQINLFIDIIAALQLANEQAGRFMKYRHLLY